MSHPHTPTTGHMQAYTKKFALHRTTTHTNTPTPHKKRGEPIRASRHPDARNHYPQIKHHTPPPKQGSNQNPQHPGSGKNTPTTEPSEAGTHPHSGMSPQACCLRTQQCVWQFFRINRFPPGQHTFVVHPNHTHYRRSPSSRTARTTEPPHHVGSGQARGAP